MKLKKVIKLALSFCMNPRTTYRLVFDKTDKIKLGVDESLEMCAEWLIKSQRAIPSDAGYSRKYSLITGWDNSYIETTGYIIPTIFEVGEILNCEKYKKSALDSSAWLLSVQEAGGAFTDIDKYQAQVFDTGQVLLGLNFIYRKYGDKKILKAMLKAAGWLVSIQEKNGSWIKNSYNNRPHAYYSRVAAALLETGQLSENDTFVQAAYRNLQWTVCQRSACGYFKFSEFKPGEDAILHTIVYVLEGFSKAYALTKDEKWGDIIVTGAHDLFSLLNDDGLLYSQYNEVWEATNKEYCITGLAQLAGIFLDAAKITQEKKFVKAAKKILDQLNCWQVSSGENIEGALPSSYPIWGYYGGMEFFNWNAKFYLDALIKYRAIEIE